MFGGDPLVDGYQLTGEDKVLLRAWQQLGGGSFELAPLGRAL